MRDHKFCISAAEAVADSALQTGVVAQRGARCAAARAQRTPRNYHVPDKTKNVIYKPIQGVLVSYLPLFSELWSHFSLSEA